MLLRLFMSVFVSLTAVVAAAPQRLRIDVAPVPAEPVREFAGEEWGCARSLNARAENWWRWQGERFLTRPAGVRRPRAETVAAVRVALLAAIEREPDPDVLECFLPALACAAPQDLQVVARLTPWTRASVVDVRAAAALALGLAGHAFGTATLLGLLADAAQEARTRAFAGYGLALAREAVRGLDVEYAILRAARAILEAPTPDVDVEVAAVHMLGTLHIDTTSAGGAALRAAALQVLWSYHDRDDNARIGGRAHVAGVVAKLLRRGGDLADAGRLRLARTLWCGDDREVWVLGVAAAQALGALCEGQPCVAVEEALRAYAVRGRNPHARGLARLSLGRIGSEAAVAFLLRELQTPDDSLDGRWTELALGVAAYGARSERSRVAQAIGEALLDAATRRVEGDRSQQRVAEEARAARLAIPLGLSGHLPAGSWLGDFARDFVTREPVVVGLSLLGDPRALAALPPIGTLLQRPQLLADVAHARVCLGDTAVVDELTAAHAAAGKSVLQRCATALALAQVGGDAGARALVAMLSDTDARSRAAAARGLAFLFAGGSPVAALRRDINYRLAPPSLANGFDGVLDDW